MTTQAPKKNKFQGIPLHKEQVDKCKELIKEIHPLNATPLSKVFPVLTPFLKCFDKNKQAQTEPLLDQENQKASKKKGFEVSEEDKEDPYNQLGFGMVAYRDLMFTLILLFLFCSVLMGPAMYFFSKGTGYTSLSSYDGYSLGNLGYSTMQCAQVPVDLNKITMSCPYGVIGSVRRIGIIPQGSERKDVCTDDATKLTAISDLTYYNKCTAALDSTWLETLKDSVKTNDTKVDDITITYAYTDIFDDSALNDTETYKKCWSTRSTLFVQFSCEQTAETIKEKHAQLSVVSCFGIFLVCVYIIVIYAFKRVSRLKQLDWDIQTITPGDYTVQYEITDQAYNWFLANVYPNDKPKGDSPGESLKRYLKREMEKLLTEKLQDKLREIRENNIQGTNISITEVKIADIAFAYNNAELIQLLRARGANIMNQKYDEMRQIEAKITELKDAQYDKLTRPCDAFITFEAEDGGIIAQEFEPSYNYRGNKEPAKAQFMGDDLFLVESTEPTNIIWENRHFTTQETLKRTTIVLFTIIGLVLISFAIMFVCKMYAIAIGNKYPDVTCSEVKDIYTSTNTSYESYAYREYVGYYQPEEAKFGANEGKQPLSGVLQCWCESQSTGLGNNLIDLESNGAIEGSTKYLICNDYVYDKYITLAITQSVSYMIVAINFILRIIIIKLITYIGKDTESEQTKLIANGVFVTQFFNTALLLLSVNANLSEQAGWLGSIFGRNSSDFDSDWFNEIGDTLVAAMIFNVYWPICEFFIYWGMRFGFRLLDRKFGCDEYQTKKTTIQQYVELYSGPAFSIHYKYSSILNITFVTMMYGVGLPILFPIAAASIFVLYCMEKIMVNYCYRQPPAYDERLNNNVLNLMTWAPVLYLSFGYWMLSSQQLLKNNITEIAYQGDVTITNHVWSQVFTADAYGANPAMPFLIMFWVVLFGTIFRDKLYNWITRLMPLMRIGAIEIDENLPNYFNAIDDNDRNWSIREEEYSRDKLNMNILEDETLKKLKSTKLEGNNIKGVHCYDVLANPLYVKDFQYFSPAMDNRAEYIIDDDDDEGNDDAQSDLVKMILNLAFLNEEQAKSFTFNKASYSNTTQAKKGNQIN